MLRRILGFPAIILVAVLVLAHPSVDDASAQEQRAVDYFFVISVDGCATRFLEHYDIPNMYNLAANGSWSTRALTVEPPLTLPATASMVSGVDVRTHGIDWDTLTPSRGYIPTRTIFSEGYAWGFSSAVFVGEEKLEHIAQPDYVEIYECLLDGDEAIMDRAIEDLFTDRHNIYFIQLPDTQTAGTTYGWGSVEYQAAVEHADYQIGRLLSAVADEGLSTRSAMIITADHGGHSYETGQVLAEDMEIPWILCGPDVRQDYEITDQMYVYDTAAAVVEMLGIPIPGDWIGSVPPRVMWAD